MFSAMLKWSLPILCFTSAVGATTNGVLAEEQVSKCNANDVGRLPPDEVKATTVLQRSESAMVSDANVLEHSVDAEMLASKKACTNTNNGARDSYGLNGCVYDVQCGGAYDDTDFKADEMCCRCGGGITEATCERFFKSDSDCGSGFIINQDNRGSIMSRATCCQAPPCSESVPDGYCPSYQLCNAGTCKVCQDLDGWTDIDGDGCDEYKGCSDAERYARNGVSALNACCICGRQEAPAATPTPTQFFSWDSRRRFQFDLRRRRSWR